MCFKLTEETSGKPLSPADFAEKAIQERLKMIAPYISKWPQAIAIQSLPPNVPKSLATLLTMVDDICYYAGDRSVDVSYSSDCQNDKYYTAVCNF